MLFAAFLSAVVVLPIVVPLACWLMRREREC